MFTGYRITSPYGWRTHPITGQRSFHTGVDMVKYHKAPIYPFVPGRISFSSWGYSGSGFGGYGNVVQVTDKHGRNHMYCHLDSRIVSVGQTVTVNNAVGYQGNTGISTASHLHYEVRTGGFGTHIDPVKYLKDYFKKEAEELAEKQKSKYFVDVTEKHMWGGSMDAINNLDWLYEQGLISGVGDNKFEPDRPLTRFEMAQIMRRIIDYKK